MEETKETGIVFHGEARLNIEIREEEEGEDGG